MADPRTPIPPKQQEAYHVAVCKRLGIDPAIVSASDFTTEVTGDEDLGWVRLRAFLPADELVDLFNAAGRGEVPAAAPPLLAASRGALTKVLSEHRVNYHHRNVGPEPVTADNLRYTSCEGCDWLGGHKDEAGWEAHLVDALLASGAVVAADILADVVKRACDVECKSPGTHTGCSSHEPYRALIAALSERGQ